MVFCKIHMHIADAPHTDALPAIRAKQSSSSCPRWSSCAIRANWPVKFRWWRRIRGLFSADLSLFNWPAKFRLWRKICGLPSTDCSLSRADYRLPPPAAQHRDGINRRGEVDELLHDGVGLRPDEAGACNGNLKTAEAQ